MLGELINDVYTGLFKSRPTVMDATEDLLEESASSVRSEPKGQPAPKDDAYSWLRSMGLVRDR